MASVIWEQENDAYALRRGTKMARAKAHQALRLGMRDNASQPYSLKRDNMSPG